MTTPTPEEQRIEEIAARIKRGWVEPNVPDSRDEESAFLLDVLSRREQEHERDIKMLESNFGFEKITLAGEFLSKIIEANLRHAEEIRKAKAQGVGIAIEAMRDAFKTESAMRLLSDPNAQRDFVVTTRTFAEDYLRAESRAPSTPTDQQKSMPHDECGECGHPKSAHTMVEDRFCGGDFMECMCSKFTTSTPTDQPA